MRKVFLGGETVNRMLPERVLTVFCLSLLLLSSANAPEARAEGVQRPIGEFHEDTVRNIRRRSCKYYSGEQVFEIIVISSVIERGPLQF